MSQHQNVTSKALIGQDMQWNDMWIKKKHTLKWDFTLNTRQKEAQERDQTTDCHAGNPCAHFDLTLWKDFQDPTSLSLDKLELVDNSIEPFIALFRAEAYFVDRDLENLSAKGTRNSNFPNNSNVTIPRRQNKGRAPNIVEPELRTIVAPMAERTMEELLRAPTEGYGEAIVLPKINADHFEIKTNLLQLVQANPFHGLENENPHAHINSFKRITSTLRFRNVPNACD
ncbi:hypothetical protein Tco_0509659 [Tanacetum coccineum]